MMMMMMIMMPFKSTENQNPMAVKNIVMLDGNVCVRQQFSSIQSLDLCHCREEEFPAGSVLGSTIFFLFSSMTTCSGHLSTSLLIIPHFIMWTQEILYNSTCLSTDLNLIVQWGRKWLVSLNITKSKLLSFHHHSNSNNLPSPY